MFPEWHRPAVLCCHFSQSVKKTKSPSIRAAAFFQMEFIIQETPDFIHDYLSGKSGFCRHSALELPVEYDSNTGNPAGLIFKIYEAPLISVLMVCRSVFIRSITSRCPLPVNLQLSAVYCYPHSKTPLLYKRQSTYY